MAVLDFFYYYLTIWFSTSKVKNRIRTPMERTAYVLGVFSCLWALFLGSTIEYFITASFQKHYISIYVYVVIGWLCIQLYKYIYIYRGRYNALIDNKPFSNWQLSNRKAINIILTILTLSVIIPFLIRIIIYYYTDK